MKPYVTAIGIGRGIAIMASELCNCPRFMNLRRALSSLMRSLTLLYTSWRIWR